jgi:hypothetical protein
LFVRVTVTVVFAGTVIVLRLNWRTEALIDWFADAPLPPAGGGFDTGGALPPPPLGCTGGAGIEVAVGGTGVGGTSVAVGSGTGVSVGGTGVAVEVAAVVAVAAGTVGVAVASSFESPPQASAMATIAGRARRLTAKSGRRPSMRIPLAPEANRKGRRVPPLS